MKSKTQQPQELNKNNNNNTQREQANRNTFYNLIFTSEPKFVGDFWRNTPCAWGLEEDLVKTSPQGLLSCLSYEPEISASALN